MILRHDTNLEKYIIIKEVNNYDYITYRHNSKLVKQYTRYYNEDELGDMTHFLWMLFCDGYKIISAHQLRKELQNALDQ